jgi:hypothetical protein
VNTLTTMTLTPSRRIDPAAVAEWFRTHPETRPIYGRFIAFDHDCDSGRRIGVSGCCGLTACTLAAIFNDADISLDTLDLDGSGTRRTTAFLGKLAGVSTAYAYGFAKGWDDASPHGDASVAFDLGFADGRAAYLATMDAVKDKETAR